MSAATRRVAAPSRDALGGLLTVAASLFFGTIVVLASSISDRGLPVASVMTVRFGFAALMLATLLAALRRPMLPARGERSGIVLLAVFGYAVEASFFYAALGHGTAAAVTLLFFTYPVFVGIGSWAILRRGAPTRRTAAALGLAVSGSAIVVGVGGELVIAPAGVALALASAVVLSGYLLGADVVMRRTQPLVASMWVSAVVSLATLGAGLATARWEAPSGWAEWGPLLGMGAASAAAFVCLLAGIRRIGAERSSIIGSSEPLAAALLAWVILDEAVGLGVAVGGALILAAAVLASLAAGVRAEEPAMP